MISDNERGKVVVINIGENKYTLEASRPNGHFNGLITLSVSVVERINKYGVIIYSAVLKSNDKRKYNGSIRLVKPNGLSVISDVDDTVKISHVTDHKELMRYTFFLDFVTAPGMQELYSEWAHEDDVMFHFVLSSPWHLYNPLVDFLRDNNYPFATITLNNIRLKDSAIHNLFKKGTETKPKQIEPILKAYPKRKFILIGDSGEQDPEVYADIMRRYSTQVLRIYIRNVTNASSTDDRFVDTFNGIEPEKWGLFTDPRSLSLPNKI